MYHQIPTTRTYGTLTTGERNAILDAFDRARLMGATDPGHAAIIAAREVFAANERQWQKGNTSANLYAIALTVAFHHGRMGYKFANLGDYMYREHATG